MSTAGAGILALFGMTAALAAAAASSHAEGPRTGTAVLDAALPPDLARQVIHALATSRDPKELEGLATQLEGRGFPLAAKALRARARQLARTGGHHHKSAPSSVTPSTSLGPLDADIDPTTAAAVMTALETETDAAKLVGFSHELDGHFPRAAAALITKAAALAAKARADQAAIAAAHGIDPVQATIATPAAAITPDVPSNAEPQVTIVTTPAAPPAPPVVLGPGDMGPPPPAEPPVFTSPADSGPLPSGPGIWRLATDADVAHDDVAGRFAALLSAPIGTIAREMHGQGRLWLFRVLSHKTDPSLTAHPKDVKAWIWQESDAPMAVMPPGPPLQPVASSATLRSVPRNPAVAELQHELNALGATPPLVEDGKMGPKTITQIKAFQRAHGLTVDGVAGPQTNGALAAALLSPAPAARPLPPPPAPPAPPPMMRRPPPPARGPYPGPSQTILMLQRHLNVLGVATPPLVEDGIEGPNTVAALLAFQSAHGLVADGIAGPKTYAAISAALAGAPPAAPPMPAPGPAPPAPIPLASARDVQHALNVLGVATPPLVEDGKAGPKTHAAVRAFQSHAGIAVDGVVGPQTRAALAAALQSMGAAA